MRIYLILVLVTTSFCSIFAQKKELRSVTKELNKGNFEKAETTIKSIEPMLVSMDEKQKSEFYLLKSKIYFKGGDAGPDETEKAVSSFEMVSSLNNPQSKEIHLTNLINHLINKGSDYVQKSDFSTAINYFSNAYRISKKDTLYLYYAASTAVNAKEYDKSLVMYEELRALGYTGIQKQYYAVNIATNMDESFDNKLLRDASVKASTHINPSEKNSRSNFPEIIKNIALIYNQKGNTEKALEAMREARDANPNDINLITTEAVVQYNLGNSEKSKSLFEQATQLDPTNPELQYNLGVIAGEAGDFKNASNYYNRAIELNSKYLDAYMNLATLILGKEEAIISEMNNLGTTAADDRRYDELREKRNQIYIDAIPHLEKALSIDPTNYQATKTLSNIFSATGDDLNAKKYKELAESLQK